MSDLPPEELVKALRMYVAIRPGGGENKMRVLKNPQGPQAAALIERLEAERDEWTIERAVGQRQLDELSARVAELEGALKQAAEKFQLYATLHAEKNTLEGNAKALANRRMAAICEAALAGDRP